MIRGASLNKKLFWVTSMIVALATSIIGNVMFCAYYKVYLEKLAQATDIIMIENINVMLDMFQNVETYRSSILMEMHDLFPELESGKDIFEKYHNYLRLENKMDLLTEAVLKEKGMYVNYLLLGEELPLTSILNDSYDLFGSKTGTKNTVKILNGKIYQEEKWFQESLDEKDSIYWFRLPENKNMIYGACCLKISFWKKNQVQNADLGVMLIGIDVSRIITDYVNDLFHGELHYIITDEKNRIIYSNDDSVAEDYVYEMMELSAKGDNENFLCEIDGIEYRCFKQTLLNDMQLISYIPLRLYNIQMLENLWWLLLVFFVVLLGEMICMYCSLKKVTYPIRRLSQHMEMVCEPTPIHHKFKPINEVGILYCSYNEMVNRQQEVYYQMLQAQINPHFLYNTLDSISCIALINGENELSDLIVSLIAMLRYNVEDSRELVTLAQEIDMVKEYITVQQFRYDGKIAITYEISKEVNTVKIPKTILQPLVENAIQYGKKKDGRIGIKIQVLVQKYIKQVVEIHIVNDRENYDGNGIGMELLNGYLKGIHELKRNSSGIGIRNVHDRLRFVFGEEFGLSYQSTEKKIIAVVKIPLLYEEDMCGKKVI